MSKCEMFTNYHCCCEDCPNILSELADDRWGYGIADDMGLHKIPCSDCNYSKCNTCADCYLGGSPECPKVKELTK